MCKSNLSNIRKNLQFLVDTKCKTERNLCTLYLLPCSSKTNIFVSFIPIKQTPLFPDIIKLKNQWSINKCQNETSIELLAKLWYIQIQSNIWNLSDIMQWWNIHILFIIEIFFWIPTHLNLIFLYNQSRWTCISFTFTQFSRNDSPLN